MQPKSIDNIQHKKGTENKVVDALSRKNEGEQTIDLASIVQDTVEFKLGATTKSETEVSQSTPAWILKVSNSYPNDVIADRLLEELVVSPNSKPTYLLTNCIIHYK